MRKVPLSESLRIIAQGSMNWLAERPIVVSFEVTNSCTCWCKHCDHGGPKDSSKNLKPTDYRRYMDKLKPAVVQVSGGEPLLRRDVVDIVRNIKCKPGGLPYTILVSNWALMNEDRYLALREAGIDQFSVSLDFPDERHDGFRHLGHLAVRCAVGETPRYLVNGADLELCHGRAFHAEHEVLVQPRGMPAFPVQAQSHRDLHSTECTAGR